MTVRMRGFLILMGSLVAGAGVYWLLFDFLADAGRVRLPAYPLALPLVGIVVGALEWMTGVPIRQLDEGWQKLHAYVKAPIGLIGGCLFLWGLIKLLGF